MKDNIIKRVNKLTKGDKILIFTIVVISLLSLFYAKNWLLIMMKNI